MLDMPWKWHYTNKIKKENNLKKQRGRPPIINQAKAIGFRKYIDDTYESHAQFGRIMQLSPSGVTNMINKRYIVVNKSVFSYRQNILGPEYKTMPPEIIYANAEGIELYINKNYESLEAFGKALPNKVTPAVVLRMIINNYIVVEDRIYSYRFDLKPPK